MTDEHKAEFDHIVNALRGRHITDDMTSEVYISEVMAEHLARKIPALRCALLPNDDNETCLTQGVGRDRACSSCVSEGWGRG